MTSISAYPIRSSTKSCINKSPEQTKTNQHTPNVKQNFNFVLHPDPSNEVRPSSLLAKRPKATDLDDLVTKKLKTSSENLESVKQDLLKGKENPTSPASASTLSWSSESNLDQQENLICSPTQINYSRQSSRVDDEGYTQLQHALDILKKKIRLDQELRILKEVLSQPSIPPQEPLNIPPLSEPLSSDRIKTSPKEKAQNTKSNAKKKNEDEFEISYGPVEFPFLSISASFVQRNDESQQKQNLLQCHSIYSSISSLPQTLSVTGQKKSQNINKNQTQKSESVLNKSEKNRLSETRVVKIEKGETKNQEIGKEKDQDREEEKLKRLRPDYEDIYSRPFPKKLTERRRNKWQLNQDEKFKGLEIPSLDTRENVNIFFEGIKKKSAITPVGPEYQVDVSIALIHNEIPKRQKPQLKWDPSSHNPTQLKRFFLDVKKVLNRSFNEEGVINIIQKNKNDLKKAKEYIKANKTKCRESLALKLLD